MISTKFLTVLEKVRIHNELLQGNKDSVILIFNELDRLESIIKDYEIGLEQLIKLLKKNES